MGVRSPVVEVRDIKEAEKLEMYISKTTVSNNFDSRCLLVGYKTDEHGRRWALVATYTGGASKLLRWCMRNGMHVSSVLTITQGNGPYWDYESSPPKRVLVKGWDELTLSLLYDEQKEQNKKTGNTDVVDIKSIDFLMVPEFNLKVSTTKQNGHSSSSYSSSSSSCGENKRKEMTYQQLILETGLVAAIKKMWTRVATNTTFDSDVNRADYVADCFSFYENRAPVRDVEGEITPLLLREHILFIVKEKSVLTPLS